jgi:hypothetical protein
MKTTAEIFEEAGRVTKATMKTLGLSVAMNPNQFGIIFDRVMDCLLDEEKSGTDPVRVKLEAAKIIQADRCEMLDTVGRAFDQYESDYSDHLDDGYDRLKKAVLAAVA